MLCFLLTRLEQCFLYKVKLAFQELKVELYLDKLQLLIWLSHYAVLISTQPQATCIMAAVRNKTSTRIFQSQNLPRRQDHIFIISRTDWCLSLSLTAQQRGSGALLLKGRLIRAGQSRKDIKYIIQWRLDKKVVTFADLYVVPSYAARWSSE